ncbi:hypothetical protein Tco_0568731 [Tanacetum coccineum]
MWTSLGVIRSVGVVNAVRCVFVDLPRKVGLQVALPATAPSTITPEATCRHLVVVVLLEDKEALNKVPVRDREAFINSLRCFAGARGGCMMILSRVVRMLFVLVILSKVVKLLFVVVFLSWVVGKLFVAVRMSFDGDLEQDGENVIGDGDGVVGGNNVNHPYEQDGGAITNLLIGCRIS